jgi:hypothetical protein
MSIVDFDAPLRFLTTAFEPDDWVAVFVKSYDDGTTKQRVAPLVRVTSGRFQAWLRAENASRRNVYVSVNAIAPHRRSRTRANVKSVRHIFLDADGDTDRLLAALGARPDIPPLSYMVRTSPDRVHLLWQVVGFDVEQAECLQKRLASELGTDRAATSCAQLTRLPGFRNHKYTPAPLVGIEYLAATFRCSPGDFPSVRREKRPTRKVPRPSSSACDRARRYLAGTPPAIAGRHGDVHTFRVCCRLIRGFALPEADAFGLLLEWNERCEPPWSEGELRAKLRHALTYGRESIGGLLEAQWSSGDRALSSYELSSTSHAPHGHVSYPRSPASTSTRANFAGAIGPRPVASLEDRMSNHAGNVMSVRIIPNTNSTPAGKLADAELIFEAEAGPLSGMKLLGFSVWERRDGGRNVTFPARSYSVNGTSRSFVLLRPSGEDHGTQEAIRDLILDAYSRIEAIS